MKVESALANLEVGIGGARRDGNNLVLTSAAGGSVDTVITVSAAEVLRTLRVVLASPSGFGFVLGLPYFWLRERFGRGATGRRAAGSPININKPW